MSCPHSVGDAVRFVPSAHVGASAGFGGELRIKVTGTVVQVHEEHRWYRAAYETPCGVQHETFKF